MSSILKALKKLEEDKVRSGEVRVDIAADILRGRPRENPSHVRGWLIAVTIAVLLVATVAVWALLNHQAPWTPVPTKGPVPRELATEKPPMSAVDTISERSLPSPEKGLKSQAAAHKTQTLALKKPEQDLPPVKSRLSAIEAQPKLTLSGIVSQAHPASRMAIINDLPVMTGGVIDGWTLERIEADQVHFVRDGVRLRIRLEEDGRSTILREAAESRPPK